jgi:hypothetical protein
VTQLFLVALGGALGSAVFLILYHHPPSQSRVLAVNCAACMMLASVVTLIPQVGMAFGLVAFGVLTSVAPLTSVLLPMPKILRPVDAWVLIRRSSIALAVNAVFCTSFAVAGYLAVYVSATIYHMVI